MKEPISAIYHTASGREYPATLYLSQVTLTIRYMDEENRQRDIYWLADNFTKLEENAFDSRLYYRNQDGRTAMLIIRDQSSVQYMKNLYRHTAINNSIYYRFFGTARKKLLTLVAVVVLLAVAAYFIVIPWVAERTAMSFSRDTEISLGDKMYQATIQQYKVDSARTQLLNQFYQRLYYKIDYPVEVTVVESDEVNAFAIPGGHIVVLSAILDDMKTPEQLAALLAHEGSHIAQRHSLRNLFRSLGRSIFVTMLFGTDNGVISSLASNADALKGLEYSRDLETEADNTGMALMRENGIDPAGMLKLMDQLKASSPSDNTPGFMSTHPVFEERMENIRKQLKAPFSGGAMNPELRRLFHELYE